MFCEKCGKQVSDSATFCRYCGVTIENTGETSADAAAATPPQAAGQNPAQQPGAAQTFGNQEPRLTGYIKPGQQAFPQAAQPFAQQPFQQQPFAQQPFPQQPFPQPRGPSQRLGYQGPQPVYTQQGYAQPGYPQQGYAYPAPRRKRGGAAAIIVVLCVLLLGAAGFIVWTYFLRGKDALAGQMSEDLSADVARYFDFMPPTVTSTYSRDGSGGPDRSDFGEPSSGSGSTTQPGGQSGAGTEFPSEQPPEYSPYPENTPPPPPPPSQSGYSTSAMPNTTQEFAWYTEDYFGDGYPAGRTTITDFNAIAGGWRAALWIDPFRDDYSTSALVMMNIEIGGSPGNVTANLRYGNLFDEDGSVIDWSELDDVYTGGSFQNGELRVGPDYDEFCIYEFYELGGKQYALGWNEVSSGVQIYLAMYRP